jgi:hypothetical protein
MTDHQSNIVGFLIGDGTHQMNFFELIFMDTGIVKGRCYH